MNRLKTCPFCGGPAGYAIGLHSFYDVVVSCGDCHAEGPIFDVDDGGEDQIARNKASANAHWNTRPK
jgi:Lar family restriction alleviation protein